MAGKIRHFKERNGRYSARLIVPRKLRAAVGKTELEVQLGPDRRQALARLPGALVALQSKIADAARQITPDRPLPARYPLTAEQIAFANYQSLVSLDTQIRAQDSAYANSEVDDALVADLRAGMAGRLSDNALDAVVGYRIERFRFRGNTHAVKGSSEWRNLAMALCVSEFEALSRKVERDEGEFDGQPKHPLIANAIPLEAEAPPVYLRTLLDGYLKVLENEGKGREARKRWTPVFEDLAQFVGHNDAARLTKQNMIDWRDAKLETLATKTVADVYLASVRAVLNWAVESQRLPGNPVDGVKTRKTKKSRVREKGYRDSEALAILKVCRAYTPVVRDNPSNMEAPQTTAAKKWAPLLCALTGARIVEITQLRKQDVVSWEGNSTIRITPEAGSVKSDHYRYVPLHPQLVELGFLEFVEGSPDGPLFHIAGPGKELQGARTTSGRISNWLQSLNLIPEGIQPNHAWRHRFKTVGIEAEISQRVIDCIQDHASRTAGEDYGDVTMAAKIKAVARIPNFEGLV